MIEIQAPHNIPETKSLKVFLAGSIDMDKAERWQEKIVNEFKDLDIVFLNPRRNDYNPNLEQNINCEEFVEQVEWELYALENADAIIFYFDPNGKAPVTMLELGLFGRKNKNVFVCCRDGFWRKGNVDIVCRRYNIQQANVDTFDNFLVELTIFLNSIIDKNKIVGL